MIRLLSACTLEYIHLVDGCRPCLHSHLVLPVALGCEWLAFPTKRDLSADPSLTTTDGLFDAASGVRMATVVGMAQKTGSNIVSLSGMGVKTVSDMINGVHETAPTAYRKSAHTDDARDGPMGLVMVVETRPPYRTLAHFRAHYKAVAALELDPSGTLLATACEDGQTINIFSLASWAYKASGRGSGVSSSSGGVGVGNGTSAGGGSTSSMNSIGGGGGSSSSAATATATAVGSGSSSNASAGNGGNGGAGSMAHDAGRSERWRLAASHLYVLQRGLTTGNICGINFSLDARWVTVTSEKGTIHFFPINRKGGQVTVRTHTSPTVTNLSSFQTSSGVLDVYSGKSVPPVEVPGALLKLRFPPFSADQRQARTSAGGPAAPATGAAMSAPLGPGDHPLPGFLVACTFHYLEHLQDSDARISWKSDAALPASAMTVMVATPSGELVEHRLLPFGPGSKERAQDAVIAGGGRLPDKDGILNAVGSLMEGVTDMFSKAAGASLSLFRQSPSVSPPGTHGHGHGHGQAQRDEAGAPHPSTAFGLACAATRFWDVCRMTNWPTTLPVVVSGRARPEKNAAEEVRQATGKGASTPEKRESDSRRASGQADANEEMAWLSNVEMSTYSAQHRRIWMGPQFTFKTFVARGQGSGPATLSVSDDGAAAGPADLYFRPNGLRARALNVDRSESRAMMASLHSDPLAVASEAVIGTPVQEAPIMSRLSDATLAELRECLADGGAAVEKQRQDSVVSPAPSSSRQSPPVEDMGVFVMDPLVGKSGVAGAGADVSSSLMEAMGDDDFVSLPSHLPSGRREAAAAEKPQTRAAPEVEVLPLKRPSAAIPASAPISIPAGGSPAQQRAALAPVELDEPPLAFSPKAVPKALSQSAPKSSPKQVRKEAAQKEAAQKEAAHREAAQREAAQREAAQKEAAQKEAAQREAAQREAAQKEAAQKEAAQKESKGGHHKNG